MAPIFRCSTEHDNASPQVAGAPAEMQPGELAQPFERKDRLPFTLCPEVPDHDPALVRG